MYWPIGAPRIYAANNSRSSRDHVLESDDDAESRETIDGSDSLVDAPTIGTAGRAEDEHDVASGSCTLLTPMIPMNPGIKPVEHDSRFITGSTGNETILAGSAEKEPLLALRISRTGHLFAVITSTSLTIWQTKVCRAELCSEEGPNNRKQSANFPTANCHISSSSTIQ
jgi:RAB6A-GEF complex partner protein 1